MQKGRDYVHKVLMWLLKKKIKENGGVSDEDKKRKRKKRIIIISIIAVVLFIAIYMLLFLVNYYKKFSTLTGVISYILTDNEIIEDESTGVPPKFSECPCGDCELRTSNIYVVKSSVNVDYASLLVLPDSDKKKAVAQMMQLLDASGQAFNIPMMLYGYSMVAMESGYILGKNVIQALPQNGYNIYTHRLLKSKTTTPDVGGGRYYNKNTGRYNPGAFGMIQVEGVWYDTSRTGKNDKAYVEKEDSHFKPILSAEEVFIGVLTTLGHDNYKSEYVNGKTNLRLAQTGNPSTDFPMTQPKNYEELIYDFGYAPAQMMTTALYAKAEVFDLKDDAMERKFVGWNSISDAEKNIIKVFCAIMLWNQGHYNNIQADKGTENKQYSQFVMDYAKYLIRTSGDSPALDKLRTQSNYCKSGAEGSKYMLQLLEEMYGKNTANYNKYSALPHIKGTDDGHYCGFVYAAVGLAKACEHLEGALSIVGGNINGSIYTLEASAATNNSGIDTETDANGTVTATTYGCSCSIPCPYCHCHDKEVDVGDFLGGNTGELAYPELATTTGFRMTQANLNLLKKSDSEVWSAISQGASTDRTITSTEVATKAKGTSNEAYIRSNWLTSVTVPIWKFKDNNSTERVSGEITLKVNKVVADSLLNAFTDIYNHPAQLVVYSSNYGGAGSFRYTNISNSSKLSTHSFGTAFDMSHKTGDSKNLKFNDYYYGNTTIEKSGNTWYVGTLSDTSASNPAQSIGDGYYLTFSTKLAEAEKAYNSGNIPLYQEIICTFAIDDPATLILKAYGFRWGGEFSNWSDGMHFSYSEGGSQSDIYKQHQQVMEKIKNPALWNMTDGQKWEVYSYGNSLYGTSPLTNTDSAGEVNTDAGETTVTQ